MDLQKQPAPAGPASSASARFLRGVMHSCITFSARRRLITSSSNGFRLGLLGALGVLATVEIDRIPHELLYLQIRDLPKLRHLFRNHWHGGRDGSPRCSGVLVASMTLVEHDVAVQRCYPRDHPALLNVFSKKAIDTRAPKLCMNR